MSNREEIINIKYKRNFQYFVRTPHVLSFKIALFDQTLQVLDEEILKLIDQSNEAFQLQILPFSQEFTLQNVSFVKTQQFKPLTIEFLDLMAHQTYANSKTITIHPKFGCATTIDAPILLQTDPIECHQDQVVLAPVFTVVTPDPTPDTPVTKKFRFNFYLGFVTQQTNDTCYRAQITLKVNSQTIVSEVTDSCTVTGYIDNVEEYNLIYWQVDVPKTYTNLPYYKVTNGTVKVTSAVLYQAALTAGYTIKVDDTIQSLTAGEVAAIVVGSSLGLLMVVTAVVTYFCTHECLWVKDLPVKKIVMVDAYQARPAQEAQEFYNATAPVMAQ